jgi:hypothetical protein
MPVENPPEDLSSSSRFWSAVAGWVSADPTPKKARIANDTRMVAGCAIRDTVVNMMEYNRFRDRTRLFAAVAYLVLAAPAGIFLFRFARIAPEERKSARDVV